MYKLMLINNILEVFSRFDRFGNVLEISIDYLYDLGNLKCRRCLQPNFVMINSHFLRYQHVKT